MIPTENDTHSGFTFATEWRPWRERILAVGTLFVMFAGLFYLFGGAVAEEQAARTPTTTLADRALVWARTRPDGHFRLRERGAVRFVRDVLVPIVERHTAQSTWPDAELVLAKSWFESRWRPTVRGVAGEHGLLQLMPPWDRRYRSSDENPLDPEVNIRIGVARLRDDYAACNEDPAGALARYARARCSVPASATEIKRPGMSERTVLGWAQTMRDLRQEAVVVGSVP